MRIPVGSLPGNLIHVLDRGPEVPRAVQHHDRIRRVRQFHEVLVRAVRRESGLQEPPNLQRSPGGEKPLFVKAPEVVHVRGRAAAVPQFGAVDQRVDDHRLPVRRGPVGRDLKPDARATEAAAEEEEEMDTNDGGGGAGGIV